MLKLASLEKRNDLKGNMICHPINIYRNNENKILLEKGTIITINDLELLESTFKNKNEFYFLISTENNVKQNLIKEFVINKIMELYNKEKEILLTKFPLLPEKTILQNINSFFTITLNSLDINYLIDLITHPIILNKSLEMGILGVFFAFQLNLSIREIEDILVACLLSDINLCNNFSFKNLASKEFNKENFYNYLYMKNSSYEMIKDDNNISNNSKRLIKYWRTSGGKENNSNGNSIIKTEDNMFIIKDITMEIVQLSNDLLTYNTDNKIIKETYRYPIINSLGKEIFKDIEKESKKRLFKYKVGNIFKKNNK